ncbi:HlyIII-domain-containing protein [Macrolepiota fuliginosa MF-IS2]|uniref:HlyIII-domain-containing protein n=1 Tax=Macrolepiota fuliginosa MF-IS2 TaxID=1400762 RepID=A0A9P5XEE6_9AGAR|nr:HlyIII-domain-containing protein [Macrolepiota fuliginosa MF-IS2]
MSTLTSTATAAATSSPSATTLRLRQVQRAASSGSKMSPIQLCQSLPTSVPPLDLSHVSPARTIASLRFLVLSHLADLERHLSELESPDLEAWKVKGEIKIEEARQWAKTALEMLDGIRTDVCSHLPDIHFSDLTSVENFLRAHIPDLSELPTLVDMRSHLPEMPDVRSHLPELPHLPDMAEMLLDMPYLLDMPDVRAHLPDLTDMRSKLDDVRMRFQEIDFNKPLSYVPTLSTRLHNLHSHLSSMEVEFTKMLDGQILETGSLLHAVLDALTSNPATKPIDDKSEFQEEELEDLTEDPAVTVARAVQHSLEGMRLITYDDLPRQWKNNPFIVQGYRFIPRERWPLLIKSVFALHNETLNIHTHLIPFTLYLCNLVSLLRDPARFDTAEVLFVSFACLCLLGSSIWHTMSGCAHHESMDFCARMDYVGIGWLISASVGTFVYYGYQCHPRIGYLFLSLCFLMGVLGNVFPFMAWFNQHEYRLHRVVFFLGLAFSSIAPIFGMVILHSRKEMSDFITPLLPSFASYLTGLVFYACHWPERHLPISVRAYFDRIGWSSHAIWHCFIVLAVSQHKNGMQSMKDGLQCLADYTRS